MGKNGSNSFICEAESRVFFVKGDQYKWLERDLAKVDRSTTPWLIATWHAPWYSTYRAHYREAECMRIEMEELLYSYGVDIIFNGHVSFPISPNFPPFRALFEKESTVTLEIWHSAEIGLKLYVNNNLAGYVSSVTQVHDMKRRI